MLRCVAKVIHTNYHIVLLPLLAIALTSAWVIGTGYFLIYLATCGDTQTDSFLGYSYVVYKFTDQQFYVLIVGIIYFTLVLFLLMTICDFLMIVSVTEWYFNQVDDSNLHVFRGLWWTFRYNLGSLVLGSMLVTWIWIFRAVGNYVQTHMTDKKGNVAEGPSKIMRKCIKCFLDCHNRFVRFLNINAYCQIALGG